VSRDPSVRTHRALADVSRARILEELRTGGPMDSRELGRRVGLHPNTVRFHVEQLADAGLVRAVAGPATGRGRPRVLYEAVEDAEPGTADGYRLLAQMLAGYLASTNDPRRVAEEVGRAWGGYLTERPAPFTGLSAEEATQRVVRLFTELGFMPESVTEGGEPRILLHRCPFREVARANPEVVCSVHLGMLRGALAELGAPVEAANLEPMVQPTLCVAHLSGVGPVGRAIRPGSRGPEDPIDD
jgi:predicted ArsR family transcriptional regulator